MFLTDNQEKIHTQKSTALAGTIRYNESRRYSVCVSNPMSAWAKVMPLDSHAEWEG